MIKPGIVALNGSGAAASSAAVSLTPAQLTTETLAAALEQSTDCVKLVDLTGDVLWMNGNGLCAMEIPSFDLVKGRAWAGFWPEPVQSRIGDAYRAAALGSTERFEAECPTFRGTPRWWEVSVSGVRDAGGALSGYLCISRDVTSRWRDREALAVLMREMRHRIGNTYAILSGLMRGFAQGDEQREQFADEMADRLTALAAAQSLLANDAAPAGLDELLEALLRPFDGPNCPVTLQAPTESRLSRAQADAIALVVGELSVNSGKHGALAHGGQIALDAGFEEDRLRIRWEERSNRPVQCHSRDGGQGLALIQMIVGARQGAFDVAWHADGLTATLSLAPDQP